MSEAARPNLSQRTVDAIRETLAGRRRGVRAVLPLTGPAVIASVAYMDPGNFATNIQAGARYAYDLLWVVVLANAVAMLFQALSAKLGIVTNRNLAELCREHFPRPVVIAMWIVSEVAAMATDLAEFLGGAIGLALLFQMPLLWGMVATAAITYAILTFQRSGFRPIELLIGGLVVVIGACYLVELAVAPPDWSAAALHSILPQLPDAEAVTLSVGIVGATVMPHAIYLHSALTQRRYIARDDAERRKLVRYSNREVVIALAVAGLVNMAMVMMAAAAFHAGHADVGEIESAYYTLVPLLGIGAAGVFLLSLMASGLSSSAVGTMAGQVIMQGFVGFRIPMWVRRVLTMLPSFAVVAMGYNATQALVGSQVVLSFALPVPMIALLVLSRRKAVMGRFVATRWTQIAVTVATAVVLGLNLLLLLATVGIGVPGLG
ncbi:MAG TPA: Nramp family divalent metal transporter [Stellaceae bacterium]|nr:Nramp family divalent metal transporter [Stellaceae bacterium]